jgi:hypothetical protein
VALLSEILRQSRKKRRDRLIQTIGQKVLGHGSAAPPAIGPLQKRKPDQDGKKA